MLNARETELKQQLETLIAGRTDEGGKPAKGYGSNVKLMRGHLANLIDKDALGIRYSAMDAIAVEVLAVPQGVPVLVQLDTFALPA